MSKYGFNPNELRKTIVTRIDKDGFHNRTVTYGKDSGGSQSSDWPTAKVTFADSNSTGKGYLVLCPIVLDTGDPEFGTVFTMTSGTLAQVNHDNPITVDIPLFKGKCYLPRTNPFIGVMDDSSSNPELAGNVILSSGMFVITGDATITVASMSDSSNPDE